MIPDDNVNNNKSRVVLTDKSKGFDGVPEIYFKIVYQRLITYFDPWLGWTTGWTDTMSFFSRHPLNKGDVKAKYAAADDEWDIFESVDGIGEVSFANETYYNSSYRVTFSSNYDSFKIVSVGIWGKDAFLLNEDDFILSAEVDYYEDGVKDDTFSNNNAILYLLIQPEIHDQPWDPDKFNLD